METAEKSDTFAAKAHCINRVQDTCAVKLQVGRFPFHRSLVKTLALLVFLLLVQIWPQTESKLIWYEWLGVSASEANKTVHKNLQ